MSIFTLILASLVALEFFYIMYLETIATTSATTARVFGMPQEELEQQSVNTLFKNQGVYNGLKAVLVLIAAFVQPSSFWLGIFMVYIILVALQLIYLVLTNVQSQLHFSFCQGYP